MLSEVVEFATSTTLSASNNPIKSGQSVTFTAVVTSSHGTPGGGVTFMDGNQVLGTGSLRVVGRIDRAVFTTSTLSIGTHTITAVYAGAGNFAGSSSSPLSEVVNRALTSTTVSSSRNPANVGQAVTFTAVVNSSAGRPGGTVSFMDGSQVIDTETLSLVSGSQRATFTTSSLGDGIHLIQAVYSGSTTFDTSTSNLLPEVVTRLATTTTVASSENPASRGQAVTFTATVSSTSGVPTGTVTFLDGLQILGSGTLTVVGGKDQATLTTSRLTSGQHLITAIYTGDSTFRDSISRSLRQSVSNVGTSTALTSSASTAVSAQPVTFTATVTAPSGTPTGVVTFKDGSAVIGTAPVVGGQGAFTTSVLALGTHSITAVYGGDSDFSGSTTQVVSQAIKTVAIESDPVNPGKSALVVGGTPGNDSITVSAGSGPGQFKIAVLEKNLARLNYTGTISSAAIDRLMIFAGDGNDQVSVGSSVAIEALLDGGAGDDALQAGGGLAILIGDDGTDALTGGTRRDILIGGQGQDQLKSTSGQDLLVGGATSFDAKQLALWALMAEWSRTDESDADRVTHITQGGGLCQTVSLAAATVQNDHSKDTLGAARLKNRDKSINI